jgi:hypothetical protein
MPSPLLGPRILQSQRLHSHHMPVHAALCSMPVRQLAAKSKAWSLKSLMNQLGWLCVDACRQLLHANCRRAPACLLQEQS